MYLGEYWPAEAVAIEAYDEDGTNHSQFPITLAVNHPYRVIAGPSPFNATVRDFIWQVTDEYGYGTDRDSN